MRAMSRHEIPDPVSEERSSRSPRRLPYEKPRVTFREPLEGVAAVCSPPLGKDTALACAIGSS